MTAKHITLVQETFPTVQSMGDALVRLFNGRLFQRDPSMRALFHSDIEAQSRKFTQMLVALVEGIDNLAKFDLTLRQMGQRHAGYGVKPEHYPVVHDALLWAIGQALGAEWSKETKAAWTALLDHVAGAMLKGESELGAERR